MSGKPNVVRRVLGRGSCVYVHVGSVHGVELVAEQDLNGILWGIQGVLFLKQSQPGRLVRLRRVRRCLSGPRCLTPALQLDNDFTRV